MPPSMRERVAERYPDLLPLLRHPEIGKLLTQAVQKNWSPGVFQSKLRASRWFRSQSATQRQWWVTRTSDPAEARRMRNEVSAELVQQADALGVRLTSKQVQRYTDSMLAQGIDPASARGMGNLIKFGLSQPGRMQGAGAFQTAARTVRAIGARDWLREPPRDETDYWGAQIALGRKTIEDFQAASMNTAANRFTWMADQIRAGRTVAEIVAPFAEAYAREMDWDPQGLMAKLHKDPKFAGLTGIKDAKTGEMRLPTEYEARTMARQRGDWWGTTSGRQADAAMSSTLLEAFGQRA